MSIILMTICSLTALAQNLTVSGVITDTQNETLIGVTVVVQGNSLAGTVTDIDGKYTLLNVPADANLEVSYVGMKTEVIPVNGRSVINVVMTDRNAG